MCLISYFKICNIVISRCNLRINGLLPIDAGIFQCMGVNPAGSVQASARLTINQPSEFRELIYNFFFFNVYILFLLIFLKYLLLLIICYSLINTGFYFVFLYFIHLFYIYYYFF